MQRVFLCENTSLTSTRVIQLLFALDLETKLSVTVCANKKIRNDFNIKYSISDYEESFSMSYKQHWLAMRGESFQLEKYQLTT